MHYFVPCLQQWLFALACGNAAQSYRDDALTIYIAARLVPKHGATELISR
jgi:hypothetical protein